MPIGVTQISTGQGRWSLIQFEVNVNTNSMIASFRSYDTSSRTTTVTMSIAFIKVNQHSIPRMEYGLSSVKTATTANSNVRRNITFNNPFSEPPSVFASIVSLKPRDNRVSVVEVTTNGFVLVTNRASNVPEGQGDDAYWAAFGKQHSISHYSTTETSTGKTWIDGKAIYHKVVQFGAMTGNKRYTIAHGISYDTIVSFDAIARNSTNSYLPLARVGYNSDSQIDASLNGYAYITPDDAIIIGGSQTNYTGATVIIEYTKA